MLIKRFKLIIGIIIPIFGFFLMSQNTFASTLSTASFDLWYAPCSYISSCSYSWKTGITYGSPTTQTTSAGLVRGYQWNSAAVTPTGNQASIHFETNIVATSFSYNYLNFVNLDRLTIYSCASSVGSVSIAAQSLSTAVTSWTNSQGAPSRTLTLYGDVALSGVTANTSQTFTCQIQPPNYAFFAAQSVNIPVVYFEQNPMTVNFSTDLSQSLLKQQITQNNTIISQNQQIINKQQDTTDAVNSAKNQAHSDSQAEINAQNATTNAINAQTNAENAANSNISNQSSSDINGATNSQTTSLISIISSFVSSLSNINTNGSCELTLPFPQLLGGDQVVNPCNGADQAPALITTASSLLLISVFVPLAFILIKMIYNEIRSFTNG